MFYEKTYLSLHNSIEIANGLKLETELATAKRSGLKNNTNYYFTIKGKTIYDYILFNTVPTRDITPNWYFSNDSHLTTYNIKLKYAPYAYYSMKDGKKTYKNITSPIFELSYTEAVSLWEDDDATYRKIQGGVKQYIKLGYFSSFSYNLQAGAFLGNRSQISPMDFQGFNTSDIWWGVKRPFQSFMLLNSYEASTSSHWMATHINYSSQYLLIKRLPFLQNTFINESLHLKGLHTPTKKYYSEIGYSLDFMGILNIGVYGSFEKFKHKERGIRLYLTFGSMGKHK